MLALTVIQPFASALITPRPGTSTPWKRWENRTWTPKIDTGEWIAIHSGARRYHPLGASHRTLWPEPAELPCSAIVGLVRFGAPRPYREVAGEPWTIAPPEGREGWCWPAVQCWPLATPVACAGALGLWTLPEAIERAAVAALSSPVVRRERLDPPLGAHPA